jgi:ketosteroid isomerase-like protein
MGQHLINLQQLIHWRQIEQLNTTFARSLDGGKASDFVSIFTEDVAYRSGPRHFFGHEQLVEFFEKRAATGRVSRHFMSSLDIQFTTADQAIAHSKWMVFAGKGPLPIEGTAPFLVADVTDELRKNKGAWLISARTITPIFRSVN